ncbi:MAG: hypothetical protein ACPGLV_08460 [Bacteroidia bacterium]
MFKTIKSLAIKDSVAKFHFGFFSKRKTVRLNNLEVSATHYIDCDEFEMLFYEEIADKNFDLKAPKALLKRMDERLVGQSKGFDQLYFNHLVNDLNIKAELNVSNKAQEQLLENNCHDFDYYPKDDKELSKAEFEAILNDLKSLDILTLLSETKYFNQKKDERLKDYLFTINNEDLTVHISVCTDSVEIESTSKKLPKLLIETIEKHNLILDNED